MCTNIKYLYRVPHRPRYVGLAVKKIYPNFVVFLLCRWHYNKKFLSLSIHNKLTVVTITFRRGWVGMGDVVLI